VGTAYVRDNAVLSEIAALRQLNFGCAEAKLFPAEIAKLRCRAAKFA